MPLAEPNALCAWAGNHRAGLLRKATTRNQHLFHYDQSAESPIDQVSLTMPVRFEGWESGSRDLHPIFQMNLPEGALLEAIRRSITKLVGEDDVTILRVTGGNQIGRNRFSLVDDHTSGVVETQESLADLLSYPDTEELFRDLVSKYALSSGVSGIQPKVILEASERGTASIGRYIVKSWGGEYPQLAANEFFCMTAAMRAGLPVPEFHLSENGGLFVMKRFDIAEDGQSMGFEDLCSLQALGTAQKYSSTYERVARSIKDFVSPEYVQKAREQFFASLVLSCIVRNGDAHLKNYGVLYEHAGSLVSLAPIYDVVTTTAYIPKDVPALSLAGSKKWWPPKRLEQFAMAHLALPVGRITQIREEVVEAVADTRKMLAVYAGETPDFRNVGGAMLAAWEDGLRQYSCPPDRSS